jgi:hypothetical protein
MKHILEACLENTAARTETSQYSRKAEIKTDLEKADAMEFQANPEEIESEHLKVCKEEAAEKTIRALEDEYGDQQLAIGRHQQPKKWTKNNDGSQKKLAVACRQMTSSAVPA